MKNFLFKLWSSMVNSQSSDVSLDRRLTVGSPSGMTAKLQVNSFMRFAVVLTLIFTIGVGNVWGAEETVTYTISSTTAVSTSGTAPTGSSASYSQKSSTKGQADANETMTLTLTGFDGCTITGLSCDAGSNTGKPQKGKGTISIFINGSNKGSLALNRPGAHSSKEVEVTSTTVAKGETIVVTISATESSLYCYSYTITYTAPACANTVTVAKTLAQTNWSVKRVGFFE